MQGKTVKMVGNMVRAGLTALALVAAPAAALAQDGGQPSSQVGGLKLGNSKAPVKIDADKLDPADVVRQAYDAIEAGEEEVCVDEGTRQVKQALSLGVYLQEPAA